AQALVTAAAGQGIAGQTLPDQNSSGVQESAQPAAAEPEKPRFAIFHFTSMRSLCSYAGALPKNLRVVSRLYREGDTYYLYLERGSASYERYRRASIQALEFGELYAATEDKLVYLEEHGECLIDEKALTKLRL
ncbi:MAG: adaptor protein MecA, partial [Acetatifactor sp.]|nr:adaptor protein MecA [Acetatifactor sp.]